mmetsp:Transcript_9542/g.30556  ORF Transcript_9542/g.30556 Transcript_9542/m.30556 type:complete len:219 (-) Transcript_9542:474-1130(-)
MREADQRRQKRPAAALDLNLRERREDAQGGSSLDGQLGVFCARERPEVSRRGARLCRLLRAGPAPPATTAAPRPPTPRDRALLAIGRWQNGLDAAVAQQRCSVAADLHQGLRGPGRDDAVLVGVHDREVAQGSHGLKPRGQAVRRRKGARQSRDDARGAADALTDRKRGREVPQRARCLCRRLLAPPFKHGHEQADDLRVGLHKAVALDRRGSDEQQN